MTAVGRATWPTAEMAGDWRRRPSPHQKRDPTTDLYENERCCVGGPFADRPRAACRLDDGHSHRDPPYQRQDHRGLCTAGACPLGWREPGRHRRSGERRGTGQLPYPEVLLNDRRPHSDDGEYKGTDPAGKTEIPAWIRRRCPAGTQGHRCLWLFGSRPASFLFGPRHGENVDHAAVAFVACVFVDPSQSVLYEKQRVPLHVNISLVS